MSTLLFRDKPIPKHDVNRAVCEKYTSYRETLKKDFNRRCGYCNDTHSYRIRSFAIDHFVPRNPKDFTHPILPNVYTNLVYSCSYCNGAKSNKFPTKDHLTPNDGKQGFVKPTESLYDDLFCRDKQGTIFPKDHNNLLASYIIEELDLKNPIHSLMYRLEKLVILTDIVAEKVKLTHDADLITLKNQLLEEYFHITRSIFINND